MDIYIIFIYCDPRRGELQILLVNGAAKGLLIFISNINSKIIFGVLVFVAIIYGVFVTLEERNTKYLNIIIIYTDQ